MKRIYNIEETFDDIYKALLNCTTYKQAYYIYSPYEMTEYEDKDGYKTTKYIFVEDGIIVIQFVDEDITNVRVVDWTNIPANMRFQMIEEFQDYNHSAEYRAEYFERLARTRSVRYEI